METERIELRVLLRGLRLSAGDRARLDAAVKAAVLTELSAARPGVELTVRPLRPENDLPTRLSLREGWKLLGGYLAGLVT